MLKRAILICILVPLVFVFHSGCRKSKGTFKIYFVGDLLLDRGVREQINKHGIAAILAHVQPAFSKADAVVANLECPVTKLHAPINKKFIFRGEPEWLPELKKCGITHLVMANNHSNDQGRDGMKDTYKNLVSNGLIPAGYGATQDEACKPVILEKNGVKVALFSSVLLTLENWAFLPDSAGCCQASVEELKTRISDFKKSHNDYKIIVMLHWGAEFHETPLPSQQQEAEGLVDAGADAIIGCHPHVIQSYKTYKGKPIFYSIGNFVFDQEYPAATRGLMVELDFSGGADTFVVHPFCIKNCVPEMGE
jgi:poly-gamma-glutamate capsule biosynthesis protein CapA/YwtB (metallophosphatase superfamily)